MMKPSTLVAGAIMLVLILGSLIVYYAGKSQGKDEVEEGDLRVNDSREADLSLGSPAAAGTVDMRRITANQGTGGDPFFDVDESPLESGESYGSEAENIPTAGDRTLSVCGDHYIVTRSDLEGVDVLSVIASIAGNAEGSDSPAGRLCTILRQRFAPGMRIPARAHVGTMADAALGEGPKQVYVLGFIETFAIDPETGTIFMIDDRTGRIAGAIGAL